jgi:hypothetical protein
VDVQLDIFPLLRGRGVEVQLGFFPSFFQGGGGRRCSLIFFLFFSLLRGRRVEVNVLFFP